MVQNVQIYILVHSLFNRLVVICCQSHCIVKHLFQSLLRIDQINLGGFDKLNAQEIQKRICKLNNFVFTFTIGKGLVMHVKQPIQNWNWFEVFQSILYFHHINDSQRNLLDVCFVKSSSHVPDSNTNKQIQYNNTHNTNERKIKNKVEEWIFYRKLASVEISQNNRDSYWNLAIVLHLLNEASVILSLDLKLPFIKAVAVVVLKAATSSMIRTLKDSQYPM